MKKILLLGVIVLLVSMVQPPVAKPYGPIYPGQMVPADFAVCSVTTETLGTCFSCCNSSGCSDPCFSMFCNEACRCADNIDNCSL